MISLDGPDKFRCCMIFFVPRGGVIFFCAKRLRDFFVPRGCMVFFCAERLCDLFNPKRLCDFF